MAKSGINGRGEQSAIRHSPRHQQTVDKILDWLPENMEGMTVCDAGAGTGSLAIPLAHRGAGVSARISRRV